MEQMRRSEEEEPEIITYKWLNQWLSLIGQDLTQAQIIKDVDEVQF